MNESIQGPMGEIQVGSVWKTFFGEYVEVTAILEERHSCAAIRRLGEDSYYRLAPISEFNGNILAPIKDLTK